MVDNLIEKIDECPLNRGQVLFAYNWDCKNSGLSGVSAIQGLLALKWMEGQLGLSEMSVISWVSAVEGCSLCGVPLYSTQAMKSLLFFAFRETSLTTLQLAFVLQVLTLQVPLLMVSSY